MNNIIDYIKWRGDLTLDMVPFNDVDAAVLSEFSYFPLEGIIPEDFRQKITIGEACKKCAKRKAMLGHEDDAKLSEVLRKSPRFSKLPVSGYRRIVDDKQQFCAMTITLGRGCHLVVFQGTDSSIVGWKEDLQLSYMEEVPAQKNAAKYMNDVGRAYRGEILTCGHSKGGNLTIYASAFCNETVSKRITRICSFDGPGFNEKTIKDKRLKDIKKRIITYAAEGSFVGQLLEHNTKLIPVKCKGADGMTQHDLFNWEMDVKGPLRADEFSGLGELNREVLQMWISGLTNEERENFVETLFSIFSDQKNVEDLLSGKSMVAIVKTYAKMDKEQRQVIGMVVNNLGSSFRTQIIDEVKEWLSTRKEAARETFMGDED